MKSENLKILISKFKALLTQVPEPGAYYRPRPYRNSAVTFRKCALEDFDGRLDLLEQTGLNVFLFPARDIPGCDLLTDSGTTTMTMEQWSQMLLGDEAYGSNEGYFELLEQIGETFGPSWRQLSGRSEVYIFHQGRAAEHALFTILKRELLSQRARGAVSDLPRAIGSDLRARILSRMALLRPEAPDQGQPYFMIPSNSHFDTTEANIEANSILPLNLPCREHVENQETCPFRGNINLEELEALVTHIPDRIPLIYLTITNNTGGGQPVSLANIQGARRIAAAHGIPLFLDACRFAENAWFIRDREDGYEDRSIQEIVHEMFEYADGFHISLKKDGLVNMGGAVVIKGGSVFTQRYPGFGDALTDHQILTEGHPTYGGLAGRDLKAVSEGLRTVVRQEYLNFRIGQVERFGGKLARYGIPVMKPIGGHAIYIDMDRFFDGTTTRDGDFKGISFTALMLVAGHRLAELGLYTFGKCRNGKEIPPEPRVNNVRAAVPRLVYEDQDLFAVAEAVRILHEHKDLIPAVNVEYGRELELRHFKSRFSFESLVPHDLRRQ